MCSGCGSSIFMFFLRRLEGNELQLLANWWANGSNLLFGINGYDDPVITPNKTRFIRGLLTIYKNYDIPVVYPIISYHLEGFDTSQVVG